MQLTLFDLQSESSEFWKKLSAQENFQLEVRKRWKNVDEVPADCQVVILDQSTVPDGFPCVVSRLSAARPNQVVIATGSHLTVADAVKIMRGGTNYVFEKPLNAALIESVFPDLVRDVQKLAQKQVEYQRLKRLFASLSEREGDVLRHVLQSVSNKNAAEQLHVSVRTIETRRAKVYRKTESKSVVELVRKVDRLARLSSVFDGQQGCRIHRFDGIVQQNMPVS